MILFCEYVIPETNLAAFLAWANEHRTLWHSGTFMESTGQQGVFVEIWPVDSEQEALRLQKERLEGRSAWREMDPWLKGGPRGLRIWIFRPVMMDA